MSRPRFQVREKHGERAEPFHLDRHAHVLDRQFSAGEGDRLARRSGRDLDGEHTRGCSGIRRQAVDLTLGQNAPSAAEGDLAGRARDGRAGILGAISRLA